MSDYVVIQTDPQLPVVLSGVVGQGEKGDPGSPGAGFATRSAMAGFAATHLDDAYLTEQGREGWFVFIASDLSAQVTLDTFQAKYVAPTSDTDGSSGAWVRQQAGKEFPFTPEMAGAVGNGTADDAPEINYLLTQGNVKGTPGKTYGVDQCVLNQNNTTIDMTGCEMKMLATFTTVGGMNAVTGANGKTGCRWIGGIYNGNKKAGGFNGIMCLDTTNVIIDGGWTIKNCSGYGRFFQNATSGVTRFGKTENNSIHIEDMGDVIMSTVTDITFGDGDGDIGVFSILHPVYNTTGAENCYYARIKGSTDASVGIEITGDATRINKNLVFEDVDITMTTGGTGLVIAGTAGNDNFSFRHCRFSTSGLAGNIAKLTKGCFVDCEFVGGTQAVSGSAGSDLEFTNCLFVTSAGGASAVSVTANTGSGSRIRIYGGTIDGSGATHTPTSGNTWLSRETRVLTNGTELPPVLELSATSSYNVETRDNNRTIVLSGAALSQSVRIYNNTTVDWPSDTWFEVLNVTTNSGGITKTIVAESGTTLIPATPSIGPKGRVTIARISASTFAVSGDLL